MLNCRRCGLTNRPYETACAHCRTPLQDRDAAEAKRREWGALPAKLREEQEQAFDRMRAGTESHLRWLQSHRLAHAILGALLVCFPMNLAAFFASAWSLPIDLAIGAAAAVSLNLLRGGSWHGLGLFTGAAILSVVLRLPFLNVAAYLDGYWFFTCFALLPVCVGGYLMGMKLDYEHRDHAVTG
jgi:hypothetical protein